MTKKQKLSVQNIHVAKPTKKLRGLAALSIERRKEIAALGGKTSHANGTAHTWTSAEASRAGKLGRKKRTERSKKS